jgi:DNA polymerase III delta prime subunit
MSQEYLFVEKYRPRTIKNIILPNNLKSLFENIKKEGQIQNILLSGTQGSGKTTIAQALCSEMQFDFITINGSEENGIDVLRNKIKDFASKISIFGEEKHKVVIIEEADYLSSAVQPALRNFIEEYSENCRFILTCNFVNRIIEPLHSRFVIINFNKSELRSPVILGRFLKHLINILDKENIQYEKEVLVQVIQKWAPDFRRVLNEIQRYAIENNNNIDVGMLKKTSDLDISELLKFLKEKNFRAMRTWVAEHLEIEFDSLIRRLFDFGRDYFDPSFIPQLVLILNEYQYKHVIVVDKEINTVAMLTEVMLNGVFK